MAGDALAAHDRVERVRAPVLEAQRLVERYRGALGLADVQVQHPVAGFPRRRLDRLDQLAGKAVTARPGATKDVVS